MNVYFTTVLVLSVTVAALSDPITTVKPAAKVPDAKKDPVELPAKKDAVKPAAKKDAAKPVAKSDSASIEKKAGEGVAEAKNDAAGKKAAAEQKPAKAAVKVPATPVKHGESKMLNDQPAGKDKGKPEAEPKATKEVESTKAPTSDVTDPATKKGSGSKGSDAASCSVNNWKMVVAMTTTAMFLFKN